MVAGDLQDALELLQLCSDVIVAKVRVPNMDEETQELLKTINEMLNPPDVSTRLP